MSGDGRRGVSRRSLLAKGVAVAGGISVAGLALAEIPSEPAQAGWCGTAPVHEERGHESTPWIYKNFTASLDGETIRVSFSAVNTSSEPRDYSEELVVYYYRHKIVVNTWKLDEPMQVPPAEKLNIDVGIHEAEQEGRFGIYHDTAAVYAKQSNREAIKLAEVTVGE